MNACCFALIVLSLGHPMHATRVRVVSELSGAIQDTGSCQFRGGTPSTPSYWDPSCRGGGLGCMADGKNPECRFCGKDIYASIPCPGQTPTPSLTTPGNGGGLDISTPGSGDLAACPSTGSQVKVLTYNLFWWNLFGQRGGNGGSAGRLIAGTSDIDFMGFQECDDVNRPLRDAGLTGHYGTLRGGHALAIAYRTASWSLLAQGRRNVGEDRRDQYYGMRGVHWGRFRHQSSGLTAFVMNFHGPLPVGTGGKYGGTGTADNILQVLRESAQSHDAIIFVGDFNQPAHASMITHLDRHLHRLYTGRSFGGVDHVFSNCGSAVSARNLGTGGSDHDALEVTLQM